MTNEELIGKILNCSWGYSMTINDYCKIIEVSKTGKTVKCRLVSKIMNDAVYSGDGSGKAKAGKDVFGPVFRLKMNRRDGIGIFDNTEVFNFHGSYPFASDKNSPIDKKMKDCSTRMGYWTFDNGKESYENHWD